MSRNANMQKTILGFVPTQSPIYKLHPVVRLIIFLATGFIPLFIERPEINLIFLVLILGLFVIAKVQLKQLKIYMPMVITVGVFITLTYILFPNELGQKIVLFKLGWIKIYYASMMWALCIYARILTLIFSSIFYFSTNREKDILVAFRSLNIPFAVTYFIGLSLRSAGIFMEDYRIIREAEQARGLDMTELSLTAKVKHFCMYMVPLFTLAIRRSEDISVALYSKGTVLQGKYKGKKRPDYLAYYMRVGAMDYLVAVLTILIFAGVVYFRFSGNVLSLNCSPLDGYFLKLLRKGI